MSNNPRHVAEALRLGAQGYVLKDSASAELLDAGTAGYRDEAAVITRAEKQLRIIMLGMATWNPPRN